MSVPKLCHLDRKRDRSGRDKTDRKTRDWVINKERMEFSRRMERNKVTEEERNPSVYLA